MLSKSLNILEKFEYVNKLLKIKVNVSQFIYSFWTISLEELSLKFLVI